MDETGGYTPEGAEGFIAPETGKVVEQEVKLISELDEKLLLESGKILIDNLTKDFPDKLPDALVLADTTARPLTYMLRPALEQIAQSRGVSMPHFVFFKTYTHVEPEKEEAALEIQQLRVAEIKQKLLKHYGIDDPRFVIIDEAIALGNSVVNIRAAFGDQEIPAYALLGIEEPDYYMDEEDYSMNENKNTSKIRVSMQDPKMGEEYRDTGQERFGFDYRGSGIHSEEEKSRFQSAKGVNKRTEGAFGSLHAEKITGADANPEAVAELRSEMQRIGEQIAGSFTIGDEAQKQAA